MPTNKPENTTSGTQGHVASTDQLGPLPEPYTRQWINAPFTERLLFTEEQMHAYARECVVAATAECSAAWQAKVDAAVTERLDSQHAAEMARTE